MRGRHEDAPIMIIKADAHDAPVAPRIDATALVALRAAFALEPVGGGWAAVLDGVAIRLEALE